ncbi:vascular endothelial growth factor D isoform X2 [Brienomyrus brachyistius]|uniref:vascular endothelial growth factor D isoform X2 n=1 Tax=Brienomyrus brachyistius TaxID=42636 RepID=UPI0020B27599|nr:vascular endothelial growth factor D isoform X2 [Brienomyrus brachyistius]
MKTHVMVLVMNLLVLYLRLAQTVELRSTQRTGNLEKWERDVRSASSLEELLMLTDFPDWKLWKCRLKLRNLETPASTDSRRSTRYAAATATYSLEILQGDELPVHVDSASRSQLIYKRKKQDDAKSFQLVMAAAFFPICVLHPQPCYLCVSAIDEEWQKTQCMPRETCVDVAKELGTHTSMFFKPPCVSVFRCSGCCNKEGVSCKNTSMTYVNKTLLTVIPFKYGPEPVLIKVANHTECKCMEPALIRRHVPTQGRSGCNPVLHSSTSEGPSRLCPSGQIWDCSSDRCVPYPSSKLEFSASHRMSDCEIDIDRCDCMVKNSTRLRHACRLNPASCLEKGRRFNSVLCSCK